MKHLIKKENNILHGTIGWSHKGNNGQYCEAGENVKIKWQPDAGWGLQEAHYTTATDPDTAVAIDLTQREFTMPADDITISGTFKKFTIGDWTSGTDAASNAGKLLGFDADGNIVPVEAGGGETEKITVYWPSDGAPYFDLDAYIPTRDGVHHYDVAQLYELGYGSFTQIGSDFSDEDNLHYYADTWDYDHLYNSGVAYLLFTTGNNARDTKIIWVDIVHV